MADSLAREEEGRRASLLFVNQHYWPDVASTGQHLTDLAEYLATRGYKVDVLCSGGRYLRGRVPAPLAEVRTGVSIRRVRTTGFGRARLLGRLMDYASFYAQVLSTLVSPLARRHDLVVFLTTPPLLSFLGRIAKAIRGQRYAIWSMDLHPDAEIASGMLSPGSPITQFLVALDRAGLRGASLVVDLGRYMKARLVAHGVKPERTRTVNVWNRKEEVEPTPRDANPLIDQLGLRDRFVVMYSGNAGVVHEFGPILEAMRRTKDDAGIFWLFVGDGPRRREIDAFVREHGIRNTVYRDYFPREQLRHSLTVADAHLISLRSPFVGISVPGKLYGIMGSGRPAIFVGPTASDSGETVLQAGCGVVIDPDASDAAERLESTIRAWSRDRATPARLGERGRAAFLEKFEREGRCAEFERAVAAAIRQCPTRVTFLNDRSGQAGPRRRA